MKSRNNISVTILVTIVLVIIAFFAIKYCGVLNLFKGEISISADFDKPAVTESTDSASTSQKATEKPATSVSATEALQASTENSSLKEDLDAILQKVCTAVNNIKHSENFNATKHQKISLKVTECSVPGLTKIANPIIEKFCKEKYLDFEFKNGLGYDSEDKKDISPMVAIPPEEKDFGLDSKGIATYKTEKNGNNTKYTFNLIEEKTTLENPTPTYHSMAMDYLDLSRIDISPAKITQADFDYSGATIEIEIDELNNLKFIRVYMPLSGSGSAKLGLEASGSMEGYIDESWTIK